MGFAEQCRVMMVRRGLTMADVGERLGVTRQAVSKRLSEGDFSESEMAKWVAAIGCGVEVRLKERPIDN